MLEQHLMLYAIARDDGGDGPIADPLHRSFQSQSRLVGDRSLRPRSIATLLLVSFVKTPAPTVFFEVFSFGEVAATGWGPTKSLFSVYHLAPSAFSKCTPRVKDSGPEVSSVPVTVLDSGVLPLFGKIWKDHSHSFAPTEPRSLYKKFLQKLLFWLRKAVEIKKSSGASLIRKRCGPKLRPGVVTVPATNVAGNSWTCYHARREEVTMCIAKHSRTSNARL